MTSKITSVGHTGNMFAVLGTDFSGSRKTKSAKAASTKSAKAAPTKSAKAARTKSAPAATIEIVFGGEKHIFPTNLQGTIVNFGSFRMCASKLYNLLRHVHSDCTSTGATKCRHPPSANHHDICWNSIHGISCNCEKIHIDLAQYSEKPPRCDEVVADAPVVDAPVVDAPVVDAPSCEPCTPKPKPKSKTLRDCLRDGDWPNFYTVAHTTYINRRPRKKLMCKAAVCFSHCPHGRLCSYAHTGKQQFINTPTRLVKFLATCDPEAQLKILEPIRDEIISVITRNKGDVDSLLGDQAIGTEFPQFKYAKDSKALKEMEDERRKKSEYTKDQKKKGKYIIDIPLHRLSKASTTDLMKMWYGLASNDHSTFALFGHKPDTRKPDTTGFLLEDFVWELARLCALPPCLTWMFYDEKYIQPQADAAAADAAAAAAAAKDGWTIEQKKRRPTIEVEDKDVCVGGINCRHGRHTHEPMIDIDGLFAPVEVVKVSSVPTADDFTALCKPCIAESSRLTDWNKLAAKHLPDLATIAPKRAAPAPTPAVKTPKETVVVVEPPKRKRTKRTKKGPIEAPEDEDFDGPRAEINFDDVVPMDAADFTISEDGKVTFTKSEVEVTKSPPMKPSKKSRKKKVSPEDSAPQFTSPEEELLSSSFDTRVTVTRPKRKGKTGEQIVVSANCDTITEIKEYLKRVKAPINNRVKNSTLVVSLKCIKSIGEVLVILSKAFHASEIDTTGIRMIDEKGRNFEGNKLSEFTNEADSSESESEVEETGTTASPRNWWDTVSDSEDEVVTFTADL